MTKHIKWCVNFGKWTPTRDEWLKLTSSIAEDEMERINKFVYKDDSKASLIGQALIRKFFTQALGRPSNELKVTRSEFGRPEVSKDSKEFFGASWPPVFDFNVSHSGDFCVLAGLWSEEANSCPNTSVGVDVTKVVKKSSKQELDRFLNLMSRREFLPSEWETVEKASSGRQMCINFTRLWCLKESFIKSLGLGLSFKLNRICFEPSANLRYNLAMDKIRGSTISDTKVILDGQLATDWRFLETALDDEHLVAIAYNLKSTSKSWTHLNLDEAPFAELSIKSLIEGLSPMIEPNEENWNKFTTRLIKSF